MYCAGTAPAATPVFSLDLLQQWLGSFVVDDAHAGAEAIRKLETILGLEITGESVGGP